MTHPQSSSSNPFDSNDKGEGYATPQVAVPRAQQQCSISTVPGTPGADSPNSLITGQSIPSFLAHEDGTSSCSNVQIGTPLAVGALRVQRSLSQITTPFPTRTHQHQPSKLSASFTFSSLLVASYQGDSTVAKDMNTSNSKEDFEREEARLLLNFARAQHQVCQLEQNVIHAQIAENTALAELHQFRASQAQRKLDTTEYDLGCLHNAIHKNGISMADLLSTRKRRCTMSDDDSIIANEMSSDV